MRLEGKRAHKGVTPTTVDENKNYYVTSGFLRLLVGEHTNPGRYRADGCNGRSCCIHQKRQLFTADQHSIHNWPERAAHNQRVGIVIKENCNTAQEADKHCEHPGFGELKNHISKALSTTGTLQKL